MANPSLARLRKLGAQAQALFEERNLPLPDEAGLSHARRVLLFCVRVYHSFIRNRCPTRAAALAYTNLLALVPLLAVAVSVSAGLLKSQGEESIQDWIREAIIRAAPMLGLKEAVGEGPPVVEPGDIKDKDLNPFIVRLETSPAPLSRYLWDLRFSAKSKGVLTNLTLPIEERKQTLAAELNQAIQKGAIYEVQRFARVELSAQSRQLLEQEPEGLALARLNHALLTDAYPLGRDALDTVTAQVTGFVSNFQSGKLGVGGVLALIFLAISLLATIESTFNDIWGVTRGRGWFSRVVQYWAALTLGPMFIISALTLTTWSKVSQNLLEQLPLMSILMPFLVPLIILSMGCALLYLVMPNTKVPWEAALLGGLVAGALLQLNSYFNVMYVSRVLTYNQIYGSMAALPLFLIGLYFSWLLVLLGAQVTYAYQNRLAYLQEKQAETVNQRGREFIGFRLMTYIGQRFCTDQRPPSALAMAEELRIPLRLVGQVLGVLVQSGLVLEIAGSELGYAPARPLSRITVCDVLQALRVGQGQELATGEDAARAVVHKEFEAIEQAWQKTANSLTFEELVCRLRTGNSLPDP